MSKLAFRKLADLADGFVEVWIFEFSDGLIDMGCARDLIADCSCLADQALKLIRLR